MIESGRAACDASVRSRVHTTPGSIYFTLPVVLTSVTSTDERTVRTETLPFAMTSLLAQSFSSLKTAIAAAHGSALVTGQPAGGQGLEDFLGMSADEQKRQLGGALLELNDGSFAYVPIAGGLTRAGQLDVKVSVKLGTVPSAQQQSMDWCSQNVKRLVPGMLTVGGKTGAMSGGLLVAGASASIAPSAGATVTKLAVTVAGIGTRDDYATIDEAVGAVGGVWRVWSGVAAAPAVRTANGIATLANARQATIARSHLFGGGSLMRGAKLEMLGLADPVDVAVASQFLANLAGDHTMNDGLSVVLHTDTAMAGANPQPEVQAVLDARAELARSLGLFLDEVRETTLSTAATSLVAMRGAGFASVAAGGNALATAVAQAPITPEEQVVELQRQLTAVQAAPLLQPQPQPQPQGQGPPQLIALAAQPLLASPGALLRGFDALRPLAIRAAGAPVLTDAELLAALGGDQVAMRFSKMRGIPDPMLDSTGPGAAEAARAAGEDFDWVLGQVQGLATTESDVFKYV